MKMTLLKMGRARWTGAAAMALLALGVLGSAPALAGIADTKHNLGSKGTGTNVFSGTEEICVFCHTPHGAAATASVPLWNRSLTVSTYTTYNSLGTSSLDGATAPVGSVSLACLSCHDGAQAMNVMINQPGSGLVTSFNTGTWTKGSGQLNTVGSITNIGTDLKNDHPIGIQYGGGFGALGLAAYPKNSVLDGGFKDADFKGVQYSNLNTNDVWWVDTGTTGIGTREKTDMQLYTRKAGDAYSVAGATGNQALVECASCHDPHTSTNATFLRISNANSSVCLACHIK